METVPAVELGEEDHTMVVEEVDSGDEEASVDTDVDPSRAKRTSVFDRLESDSRLKFSQKEMNFAKAVGKENTSALSFFPLASKDLTCVRIPKELASEVLKTHRATLFGYFLGPRLPFPIVEKYVKAAWGKFGFSEAMMNNNGIYFFKFNDVGGSNQVVEGGPLMIRGVPLFLDHWDPTKGLVKPIHTSCPLWVKLHNVPLVAFNKEGISRIASALGIPKQMDACTSSMCDKSWGRPGFAKVLVEAWAVGELKRELQVLIPSLSGGEDSRVTINVEYDWEPTQCSHCMVFGHKTSTCVKALVAQKAKGKAQVVDDQGFTKVQRREWRPKPKPGEGSTSGTAPASLEEVPVVARVDGQNVDKQVLLEDNMGEGGEDRNVQQQSGGNLDSAESAPVVPGVPRPQQISKPKEQPTTRHLSVPLDVPLKTILKNPNRFSPLADEDASSDKGNDPGKASTVTGKSVLNAPKKPGVGRNG
ncbi:hypothetical protein OSB04_un000154 [Centaurea solstitialis]|uniref:DUF4283 domain-containing protein n=1 Tax=Centaurea solstitialis TaxID=347529 RepID=A0AA38SHY1_9ASTR|nr:hypothetical protein OSB04_un000154 [Centaurea solstitialis]